MIAGIEGILKSRGEDWAVVDVGGVSFRIQAPTSTIKKLGSPGSRVQLATHLHVREDNLSLYGFSSAEELELFELVINVSGIGPKIALALLSAFSPERFESAIARGDTEALSSVSGVGKKTAARLALELKGKFEKAGVQWLSSHDDVRAALISLGYSAAEANSAIANLPDSPEISLEEEIKLALQYFSRSR
ncbi:MAG TPA: Holliday junction branch migration protein RuvA [Dehalococcoidia bacterium]|nr:Holliday junction branch migration protein RuvA [Dehalococcoidia bacterium]